jgi:hypothetical protein
LDFIADTIENLWKFLILTFDKVMSIKVDLTLEISKQEIKDLNARLVKE